MSFRIIGLAAALTIFVSGCAKSPESIAPAYVSPIQYRSLDCSQLSEESTRIEQALTQVSEQQRNARTNDVVGVILIGLPVSSLSGGNVADQVAKIKGEQETLRKVMIEKKCT